jgi:hypothetical protein
MIVGDAQQVLLRFAVRFYCSDVGRSYTGELLVIGLVRKVLPKLLPTPSPPPATTALRPARSKH